MTNAGVDLTAELVALYEGHDVGALSPEIIDRLPRHKDDVRQVKRLIQLGYPANASSLPFLAVWLQDANWPIARPVAEYLSRLGWALLPVVRQVLRSNDELWVYWMLELVVGAFDDDLVRELRPELARWAASDDEDAAESAQELLGRG